MEAGGEGLDEEEGVVWWCVMIVEYRNAFNKLAHDPFYCTASPGLGTYPGLGLSRICILSRMHILFIEDREKNIVHFV